MYMYMLACNAAQGCSHRTCTAWHMPLMEAGTTCTVGGKQGRKNQACWCPAQSLNHVMLSKSTSHKCVIADHRLMSCTNLVSRVAVRILVKEMQSSF